MGSIKPPALKDLSGPNAGRSKTPVNHFTWADTAKHSIDLSGLGLSDSILTGQQALAAIENLAHTNPAQWGAIRTLIANSGAYGAHKPDFSKLTNWSSTDLNAVKNALIYYHAGVGVTPTTKTQDQVGIGPIATAKPSFLQFTQQSAAALPSGAIPSKKVKLISLPSTDDLNAVAHKAFVDATGFNPTPAQAADFAQKFQGLLLSYGKGQNNPQAQQDFAPPANVSAPMANPAVPPAPSGTVIEPPSASVAAQNFALKANPATSASHGMNEAISLWLGNLAKGNTNGQ